jgi:hypothetical protein
MHEIVNENDTFGFVVCRAWLFTQIHPKIPKYTIKSYLLY